MDVSQNKKRLRAEVIARRDAEANGHGAALLRLFEQSVLPKLDIDMQPVVSGFSPMGSEADVMPVLERLVEVGFTVGLPVVTAKGVPLTFRPWRPGAPMVPGVWNILVPDTDQQVVPDVLLVPLVAFDEDGYRLGYGGGFYDRTIERITENKGKPLTIGVALECQKVAAVPREPWDVRLDMVLTEQRLHVFGDGA